MWDIEFTVPGRPRGKGSLYGRFPHHPKKTVEWQSAVAMAASAAMVNAGLRPTTGRVKVLIVAGFQRPKNHYGTGRNADKLKSSAPESHIQKPDVDKLARSVLDGLTGIVYSDDSQVTGLRICKIWLPRDIEEGVEVRVEIYKGGSDGSDAD